MNNYYDYVSSHPEELRQFSCKDLLFLIIDCPPDFTKGEDWSQYNCFLHVLTGNKKIFSRENEWYLEKGSTVFLKKGGIGIERIGDEPFCALMFYVPDDYICNLIRNTSVPLPINENFTPSSDTLLPVESNEVLAAFYVSVLPYFSKTVAPHEDLLELKFKELFINIITNPVNKELTAYFCKLLRTCKEDLKDVMERNYLYNLQLHEFARLCHRSLSKFKRDFHEAFGTAPGRWLIEKRLKRASQLLIDSDKTILEITMDCGFLNTAHFCRAFKKIYGASPLHYRQSSRMAANTVSPGFELQDHFSGL
ncbi:MAG TPA: AraC family transcriptional regulator, partial [Chitinophagaceae bacterium]|nr:AraC family transcriptional regulator [Chitinophagaceae bacterium]